MVLSLNISSPKEVADGLARRVKRRRLEANMTQEGLASRAQVSLGTLKLFERTGKASIEFLIMVAFALDAEKEFERLFPPLARRSISDVVAKPARLRGRRK
jgi:transcriptional regulator with XRE-family HTH domain